MNAPIIYTVVTLVAIGTTAAVILYVVARKFMVYEDPRIDTVERPCRVPIAAGVDTPDAGHLQKPV